MSNTEDAPGERTVCYGPLVSPAEDELLWPRQVPLGGPRGMLVRRVLPNRYRRMVGPWCFVDSYGPADIADAPGMQVPPHPHTGLQTVSWLLDGEVLHRDSLGSDQLIRPGELNLMTAGNGIAHSEESPAPARRHRSVLHGIQLWVALPAADRHGAAGFEHHAELPTLSTADANVTVIMGELAGLASPATAYSPLVAAEVALPDGGELRQPVDAEFEHAVLKLSGRLRVDGNKLADGSMLYLAPGRTEVRIDSNGPGRALLLGGRPFTEKLVMWWNFVGRSHEEIVQARVDWEHERAGATDSRFGVVHGYAGAALPAPELPQVTLRPRGRSTH
ncbi:hypothetical protein EV191_101393 [Tamaricihabitans halophyticus]|uniref:Pirin n=1 Tax=Tamaricihabitans halophyticus TaxID=1262583 RepID=A0A4R2R198_9PSEU|nr:pirin family protein [Tamaricihabitans halophyticus]TCP56450.1 hypothetical protein EV191_101393 [Tamaricihabitans halophyticus]